MMDFWRSATGMVEVELTSAETGAALAAVNQRNISIYDVSHVSDLTVRFRIRRADYRALLALTIKRGDSLRLCRKIGLYWRIKNLTRRPFLVAGTAFMLFLLLFVPTRVLFVRVEGNVNTPARQILAAAEESGICFWASRREVRSERVKNALLSALPELQWAGVNTSGCVAVISVRERTVPEKREPETGVSSIVAGRDGVVDSCTATRGNLLCQPGQAVKAGQVLISGYTDCGLFLQATRADGEVYALTKRHLDAVTPSSCLLRGAAETVKHKISLIIGKNRINLWKDSGIWDTTCGRMYTEYYITLPGDFRLPIALAVETYSFRETTESYVAESDAKKNLTEFSQRYLTEQMVAGRILSGEQALASEDGVYRLTGSYVCHEMIGRVQPEQIGE